MEQSNNHPWQDNYYTPPQPAPNQSAPNQPTPVRPVNNQPFPPKPVWPPRPVYAAGKKEQTFGIVLLICCVLLADFVLCGGFSLGFAISSFCVILCSAVYMLSTGHRMNWYSAALILINLAIAAGFGRSADVFVKFVMAYFMTLTTSLALCLMARQNRHAPGSIGSILDAYRAMLILPCDGTSPATRGLWDSRKTAGSASKKGGALVVGLLLSLPIIAILVGLLIEADAAFEGMLNNLPHIDLPEIIGSLFFGILLSWFLYSRGVSLHQAAKPQPLKESRFKGFNAVTINTVLCAVGAVYALYLVSQLAYISGGFSGILPEEFTMAEYARRGFFEMALLCGINLGIISLAIALVAKKKHTPIFTRILCLFIGLVTVFLVASASAKMFMYIGGYGLTRYRVLTEVIMIWLGLSTVIVCLWVFFHKLPYMKLILILALVMGAAVFWTDVDTLTAKYNVEAYQSGKLAKVDVEHLTTLGPGAARYIALLENDPDPAVANEVKDYLYNREYSVEDFRDWNAAKADGAKILAEIQARETARVCAILQNDLGIDFTGGELQYPNDCTELAENGQTYYELTFTDEQGEALKEILAENSQWNDYPLPKNLDSIVHGKGKDRPHFTYDDGYNLLPNVEGGFYFFRDNHPECTDPTDVDAAIARDTYNFVLAIYNSNNNTLYYFAMDTVSMPAEKV